MKKYLSETLRLDERVLVRIERPPWSALYRIGIGYAILPVFYLFSGNNVPEWWIIVWFLGVLLTLRLIPAIARKAIPFSGTVRDCWIENRQFAKDFKMKIEMRQIGARQEASRVGGIGPCGRELCCSTWLTSPRCTARAASRRRCCHRTTSMTT